MSTTLRILAVAWLAVALTACGAAASGVTTTLPATTSGAQQAAPAQPAKATTCEAVRETLLTGTPAEVAVAMKALVADKTASQGAREQAKAWLSTENRDLKNLNASVIQMACENAGS